MFGVVALACMVPGAVAADPEASPSPVPSPSPVATPAGPDCPQTLRLASSRAGIYRFVLSSSTPETADVDLELFLKSEDEYSIALHGVDVRTPEASASGAPAYRSRAIAIKSAESEPFYAAIVKPSVPSAKLLCREAPVFVAGPKRSDSDLDAAIAAEAESATPLTPLHVIYKHYACAEPFGSARAVHAVPPNYPLAARSAGVGGTATIKVDLSEAGNVIAATVFDSSGNNALDQAALIAAERSTYQAQLIACRPVGGSYLFRAQFDTH